ncbi:CRISPR type III-A/MTUBE-associated RAMP protein Csm5 [Candidatus Fervidibacteria bacterium JGI MDM2 SSWTFF-3-K9]
MKWNEPITLTVRILSPIVIGTGEKCNTLGFVVDGRKVLVVDERRFLSALSEHQQQRFLRWLEPLAGNLAHIRQRIQQARDNQQLRQQLQQQRRETENQLSLERFLRESLQMPQPVNWLRSQKAVRYEVVAVRAPDRYEGFAFCLKTPDHRPYIPGSELKGAIRTAVLTKMLNGNANLLRQLAQNLQPNMTKGQLNALWQETEWMLLRRNRNDKDAHNDLFRGIAISDSEPLPTDALRIYAAKRLNMSRDVTVFVEAIAPECETSVTLSVARPDRWLREIGLTDKAGWLDWTKLAQALYEHANAVLDFIARKFPQVREKTQWLKEQNKPDEPLVCLGWGQGFLSVTMTEPLLRRHSDAYETLRQAMAQAISQYGRTKQNNFPKTIWAALDRNGQPYDLFGWVKLVRG